MASEHSALPALTEPGDDSAARNERKVRRDFWAKVRATLGRVPFLDEAVAAFFCATDAATPLRVKAVLFGALAYFITPVDMLPDFIALLGYTDDATVLFAAIRAVAPHITDAHRARARRILSGDELPN